MLRSATRQGRWRRWYGAMGGHGGIPLSTDQQRVLDEHRMVAPKQIGIVEGPPGTGKSVCAASFLLDVTTVSVPTLVFAPSSESHSPSIPMLRYLQERTQLGYVDSLPHMQVQSFAQWCQAYNDEFSTTQVMSHAETVAFVFQHVDSIEYPSLRSSYKSPPMLQRAVKDLLQLFQHLESHGISSDEYKSIVAGFVREGSTMSPVVFDDFVGKQTDLCGAYAAYRGLLAQHNVTTWHGSVCDTLSHIQQHPFYLHAAVSQFDRILVDDLHAMTPAMLKVLSRVVVASSKQHCVAFTRPSDNLAQLRQFVDAAAIASSVQDMVWIHSKLTTNLYSSPSVVQAAAAIAAPSARDAMPHNPAITSHSFSSPQDEVDFIANLVASAGSTESVTVVCADRRDVPLMMAALHKRGLDDAQSLERQNVFDAAIVQTAHALLQALANPSVESKCIFSLLHTSAPWRIIPSKLAAIMELQRKRHVPLLDVLVQLAEDSSSAGIPFALDAASLAAIQSFVTVFTQMQELSTTSSCLDLLHAFFTKTGDLESLMQPTSEADAVASQALAAYFNAVGEAQHATKSLHVPFVAPYLQLLKESGRLLHPRDADTDELSRVTVLSIKTAQKRHVAADTIVFMGMTDKAFPGRKPRQPTALPTALVESISTLPSSSAKRLEFLEGCRDTLSRLTLCAKSKVVFCASGDTPSRILAPLWQAPIVHASAADLPSTPSAGLGRDDGSDSDRPFHVEHVSFSQLDEYMRCPHRYYLARVVKIEPPTAPGLVYGRSLHEGIAAWSAAPSSPHAVQNALDALTTSWEPGCFRSRDEEELLLAQATDALMAFIEFETSNPSRIASVETPFDIDVPEANARLKGVWDRIDIRSDGTYVVEFKSNLSNGPRNNQALAESSLQLKLYMLAYARVHGVPPKGGVLRSLESPHGLNDEGLILYDANADDQVLQGVVDTVQRIRRGEFDAAPSFMGCAYCPFADVCPSKL